MINNSLREDLKYTYNKLSKEEIEKLTGISISTQKRRFAKINKQLNN